MDRLVLSREAKERRQVFPHLPPWIADSVHGRPLRLVGEHRRCSYIRTESNASRGQIQPRLPAVQRIVVTVADERSNASRIQPRQPLAKLQLCPQAAVGPVVNIASNQQPIDLLSNAQVDDVFELVPRP